MQIEAETLPSINELRENDVPFRGACRQHAADGVIDPARRIFADIFGTVSFVPVTPPSVVA